MLLLPLLSLSHNLERSRRRCGGSAFIFSLGSDNALSAAAFVPARGAPLSECSSALRQWTRRAHSHTCRCARGGADCTAALLASALALCVVGARRARTHTVRETQTCTQIHNVLAMTFLKQRFTGLLR